MIFARTHFAWDDQLNDFNFNMLEALASQSKRLKWPISMYAGDDLEGAPHLKDEHLPILIVPMFVAGLASVCSQPYYNDGRSSRSFRGNFHDHQYAK